MGATARIVLGVVTLLLLASAGGGFLLVPLLIPLHVLAARHAGPLGRLGWPAAAGSGIGMTAWAATYMLAGEGQPVIWLVPLVAASCGALLVHRATV